MSTHGKAHEELPGALCVMLVEEVVQRLVESLAMYQYHSSAACHASLDRLDIYTDLWTKLVTAKGENNLPIHVFARVRAICLGHLLEQ